jgi:hypothetical protein
MYICIYGGVLCPSPLNKKPRVGANHRVVGKLSCQEVLPPRSGGASYRVKEFCFGRAPQQASPLPKQNSLTRGLPHHSAEAVVLDTIACPRHGVLLLLGQCLTSRPTSQPASRPAGRAASQPISQQASRKPGPTAASRG